MFCKRYVIGLGLLLALARGAFTEEGQGTTQYICTAPCGTSHLLAATCTWHAPSSSWISGLSLCYLVSYTFKTVCV